MKRNKFRIFLCNFLGWHKPVDEIQVGLCNLTSKCRYCCKKIIQDSQGNWFVLDMYREWSYNNGYKSNSID